MRQLTKAVSKLHISDADTNTDEATFNSGRYRRPHDIYCQQKVQRRDTERIGTKNCRSS